MRWSPTKFMRDEMASWIEKSELRRDSFLRRREGVLGVDEFGEDRGVCAVPSWGDARGVEGPSEDDGAPGIRDGGGRGDERGRSRGVTQVSNSSIKLRA